MKKIISIAALAAVFACCVFSAAEAAKQPTTQFEKTMRQWIRTSDKKYEEGQQASYVEVSAAYFSAEYIEAHINDQAQKNLWTADEMEEYKLRYLTSLQLDKTIPFLIKIDNSGPSMHMAPFDSVCKLRIGNKTYEAIDYDKRFNFRLLGEIEGLIFFPRYDEKTGKPVLEGAKSVSLEFNSFMSPILKNNISLIWTITNDDVSKLYQGKTAARLETDRLIERLQKLNKDKGDLDKKSRGIQDEIDTIQKRLDELNKQLQ